MNIVIIGFGELGKKYFKILKKYKKINISIIEKKKQSSKIKFYEHVKFLPRSKNYYLLIICTPPKERLKIFKSIDGLKIENIICEKPIANSFNELKKINKIVNKNKIKIYTNYIRKFINEFQYLNKLINSKKFGKPVIGHFYYSKGIYYNGVHFLSYVLDIFGKPNSVKLISKKQNLKNDYLCNFILRYNKFVIYFLSFDINKVASINFDLFLSNGKIEVNLEREYKLYKINKNKLIKNINQFTLFKKSKINYLKGYSNLIKKIIFKKNYKDKNKIGFQTNDYNLYSLINKILKKN